jgi:hypothetical protein
MSEDVIHHIMGVPQETDINFLQQVAPVFNGTLRCPNIMVVQPCCQQLMATMNRSIDSFVGT